MKSKTACLRFSLSCTLLPLAGILLYQCQKKEKQEYPNIIFIMADDLGYGELGSYGCKDIQTPYLDQLAADGIRFTNFYANSPVCTPTRVAFLTGRYQQRSGIDNALVYQEKGRGLPVDGETIADALGAAGNCKTVV